MHISFATSYQEAIDKYESVMKTEPNVPFYSNLAKERICFSLVKVSGGRENPCAPSASGDSAV